MRSIRHPLSGAIYDRQADGTIKVEKDRRVGIFEPDGTYISGEIFNADPHLCGWIGGRELAVRPRHTQPARRPS